MDEYGVFGDVESDYQALWAALQLYGAITFTYGTSRDANAFTVTIVPVSKQLGVKLFGDDSVVAVHGFGAFPFRLNGNQTSVGYVSEKLGLGPRTAMVIATLINGIRTASQAVDDNSA